MVESSYETVRLYVSQLKVGSVSHATSQHPGDQRGGDEVLIDAARRHGVDKFIHISTDEVYGSVTEAFVPEDVVLDPSSAYSASKTGSDLLVRSYGATFGRPATVAPR